MAVFVDTNVLVYARDLTEPEKRDRANAWLTHLWRTGEGRVSFQVLNEYYVTVTRKLKPGFTAAEAQLDVRRYLTWSPRPLDAPVLETAWAVEQRHRTSFWDALVVAAAQLAGCEVLLTEDLSHDRDFEGVRVVDPFRQPPPGAAEPG